MGRASGGVGAAFVSRRMNRYLPVLGFVAVLTVLSIFFLPMRELCACLSSTEALAMNFGTGQIADKHLMADAQLSKEVRAKMEGFDIQKDYEAWNKTDRPDSPYSWISWLDPNGGVPGDCRPSTPWKKDTAVSCKFYGKGNLVRKAGYQLDFRITPDGIIGDVKFYKLSTVFGIAMLETVH